jgi:hypothetical protein
MDTALFLEAIAHFSSYLCCILSHRGRMHIDQNSRCSTAPNCGSPRKVWISGGMVEESGGGLLGHVDELIYGLKWFLPWLMTTRG